MFDPRVPDDDPAVDEDLAPDDEAEVVPFAQLQFRDNIIVEMAHYRIVGNGVSWRAYFRNVFGQGVEIVGDEKRRAFFRHDRLIVLCFFAGGEREAASERRRDEWEREGGRRGA